MKNDADRVDAIVYSGGYDHPDAPGLSVIVIRKNEVLARRAYGLADIEAGIPNTTQTNFRLASVSKQFTAMAILILKKQGKLRLEDRLTDFFPTFPAYGREMTIHHLLNHTSGLPDYAAHIPVDQQEQLKDTDVLRILEHQTHGYFPPGSEYQYSNAGYVLLGLIVSKVSQESFADFLTGNIFRPLGMTNTVAYESGISTVQNRAYGYAVEGERCLRNDQSLTSATLGDGGIYSSIEDMYRWDRVLYTTELVSASTLQQAFTPGEYGEGKASSYGFGWSIETVRGVRKVSHEGATVGFRTYILRLPELKFTVIVLMNREDGTPVQIANGIARSYFPDLVAPLPPIENIPPAVLESYVGHYDVRGSVGTCTVRAGKLLLSGTTRIPVEMLPLSPSSFCYGDVDINPERDWRITFKKGTQGWVKGFTFEIDGKEEFTASYLGPLAYTLDREIDPDPEWTRRIEIALKDFVQNDGITEGASCFTVGAKRDIAKALVRDFAGLESLIFLAARDVSEQGVERHGSMVDHVLYYELVTDRATRYVLLYRTIDGLIADEDIVEGA